MSVYEQLKAWQRIPHARREWTAYRKKLTDFVLNHTEPETTIALLGAGHCDDLDLSALSAHFRQIILVDRETEEVQGALEGYHISNQCELIRQNHDFLGITSEEYENFNACLQQGIELRGKNTDIRDLAELAQRKLDKIYEKLAERPLTLVSTPCDYLIAAGLHSQLDNMMALLWNAYEQALGQHADWMYPYFAKQSDSSVRRFDEQMLQSAKRGILCAFEKQRLGVPGNVQGAARGMADMEEAVIAGRLKRTAREKLYWNFDLAQGIAYEMQTESFVQAETESKSVGLHEAG